MQMRDREVAQKLKHTVKASLATTLPSVNLSLTLIPWFRENGVVRKLTLKCINFQRSTGKSYQAALHLLNAETILLNWAKTKTCRSPVTILAWKSKPLEVMIKSSIWTGLLSKWGMERATRLKPYNNWHKMMGFNWQLTLGKTIVLRLTLMKFPASTPSSWLGKRLTLSSQMLNWKCNLGSRDSKANLQACNGLLLEGCKSPNKLGSRETRSTKCLDFKWQPKPSLSELTHQVARILFSRANNLDLSFLFLTSLVLLN